MNPTETSRARDETPHDGSIKLVGHHVGEGPNGELRVEAKITYEGRTFDGTASGSPTLPDRLKTPALATLRALDACLQVSDVGVSHRALVLDDVIEVSVGDFPVALVMITASGRANPTRVVAACPLVGMSDLAIILATLQATTRIVSHWLTGGEGSVASEQRDRPQ